MLIFAACLAIFVYGMVASMVGTINPALAAKFDLNNVQTSYLALAQGIGLVVASVSVGPLMDRQGKKVGLVLGLTFVAVAMLALGAAPGFEVILVAMAVMGMGGGIVITGANALGSDVSESRRASVLNFLNVFVGLGGLATPFVAGNLLAGDAVRVAYAAAALTIVTLLVHLMLRIPRPVRSGTPQRSSAVFSQPILYVLGSATFLYTACEFGVWNWLVKYLMTRGVPATTALNVLSLGFGLGLLLGRVAVMPILIRVPPATVTVAASVLMALTTFAMLHVSDPTLVGVVVFLAGVAMAPVFPTTIAIVGDVFKEGSATAIGFTITCGFSGLVVSSPLIGWLAGPDPAGLGQGLLLLPAFSVALLLVNLVIRKRRAALLAVSPAPA
ncbi:MAG: MFS transporter [Vicinamibacteraceae bacterium]|nr:MFS transporter [Vicinamibacteraceae bacterium]